MIYLSGMIDPRGVGGVTWARASAATRGLVADANGERVDSVASGVPRDSHVPSAGMPAGILVEPARMNSLLRSSEMNNAAWQNEAGTPVQTIDARPAPDGNSAAEDYEDDDGANAAGEARGQIMNTPFVLNDIVTASVFARVLAGAGGILSHFDAAAWNNTAFTSALWARVVRTATMTGAQHRIALVPGAAGTWPTAEVRTGKASFWGAQSELGAWASSHIPTVAAAVTRAADVCSIDTNALAAHGFSARYGQARMVWVPAFGETQETGAVWLLGLDANTGLRYDGTDDVFEIFSGGARVAATPAQTFTGNGTTFLLDLVWNGAFCQLSVLKDGANLGGFQGTWTAPTLGATVALGGTAAGAAQAGGTYSNIRLGR